MLAKVVDVKILAIAITCFLWYWTARKHQWIININKTNHLKNTGIFYAFLSYLIIEIGLLIVSSNPINYLASLLCILVFMFFLIENHKNTDSFLSKNRNQFICFIIILFFAIILAEIVSEGIIIPVIFSVITAHICNIDTDNVFFKNLRDLASIKDKLMEMDAKIFAQKNYIEFTEHEKNTKSKIVS